MQLASLWQNHTVAAEARRFQAVSSQCLSRSPVGEDWRIADLCENRAEILKRRSGGRFKSECSTYFGPSLVVAFAAPKYCSKYALDLLLSV